MSQNVERNIVIGGVVVLLLFLLLRKTSQNSTNTVAPPLPDEDKITPSTFEAQDYPLETLQSPPVNSLSWLHRPTDAPMVTITPPDFVESVLAPVRVSYPLLTLVPPSYADLSDPSKQIGSPSFTGLSQYDSDGIGSTFTLIGTVPACEC